MQPAYYNHFSRSRFFQPGLQIRDMLSAPPLLQATLLEFLHTGSFANRDYKLPYRFDLVFCGPIVHCADQVFLALGVLILWHQATISNHSCVLADWWANDAVLVRRWPIGRQLFIKTPIILSQPPSDSATGSEQVSPPHGDGNLLCANTSRGQMVRKEAPTRQIFFQPASRCATRSVHTTYSSLAPAHHPPFHFCPSGPSLCARPRRIPCRRKPLPPLPDHAWWGRVHVLCSLAGTVSQWVVNEMLRGC
jgi:hypothetical protein